MKTKNNGIGSIGSGGIAIISRRRISLFPNERGSKLPDRQREDFALWKGPLRRKRITINLAEAEKKFNHVPIYVNGNKCRGAKVIAIQHNKVRCLQVLKCKGWFEPSLVYYYREEAK